jgi:hypothetical protein
MKINSTRIFESLKGFRCLTCYIDIRLLSIAIKYSAAYPRVGGLQHNTKYVHTNNLLDSDTSALVHVEPDAVFNADIYIVMTPLAYTQS